MKTSTALLGFRILPHQHFQEVSFTWVEKTQPWSFSFRFCSTSTFRKMYFTQAGVSSQVKDSLFACSSTSAGVQAGVSLRLTAAL